MEYPVVVEKSNQTVIESFDALIRDATEKKRKGEALIISAKETFTDAFITLKKHIMSRVTSIEEARFFSCTASQSKTVLSQLLDQTFDPETSKFSRANITVPENLLFSHKITDAETLERIIRLINKSVSGCATFSVTKDEGGYHFSVLLSVVPLTEPLVSY